MNNFKINNMIFLRCFNYYFILIFILVFPLFIQANQSKNCFVKNHGQWNDSILFMSVSKNLQFTIRKDAIYFDFFNLSSNIKNKNTKFSHKVNSFNKSGQLIKLVFANSNKISPVMEEFNSYYQNYFIGNDKSKWQSNVITSSKLRLQNIYNGIDLIFYYENNQLRYDFIIKSGANPSIINMNFEGVDSINVVNNELIIFTKFANIFNHKLFAYQSDNSVINKINCNFKINNTSIVFQVDNYDKSKDLIIDPLIYSTFLGGSDYDVCESMVIDKQDCAYLTGYTSSTDFATTLGAYSRELSWSNIIYPDIFVTKFDSLAQKIIFSTYIGGYLEDFANAIKIDANNNIYITGYTSQSKTFPVTSGAYDTLANGAYDGFIIKLDSLGSNLIFSTLIGGTADDFPQALTLDKNNNIYITGYTYTGGNFPTSNNAFQKNENGLFDIFVSKISNNGSSLLYSTLLGGQNDDFGQDIQVDDNGYCYITGITRSRDFPLSANSFQSSMADSVDNLSSSDCILSKFSLDASTLIYSSYFGGSAPDASYCLALDDYNNIYIAGTTESWNFPISDSAYNKSYNNIDKNKGKGDCFVAKFISSAEKLIFSTFIGGIASDKCYSIDLDNNYNIYLTGSTSSPDFPVSFMAFDSLYHDSTNEVDSYIAKINNTGSKLLYASYLGGNGNDIGQSVKVASDASVIIAGNTSSKDFPTTITSFDTLYNDKNCSDIFLSRINLSSLYINIGNGAKVNICKGDSIIIGNYAIGGNGNISYSWSPTTGLSNPFIAKPYSKPSETTTYTLVVKDENNNIASDIIIVNVIDKPFPIINGPTKVISKTQYNYNTENSIGSNYDWTVKGGLILTGQSTNLVSVIWNDTINGLLKVKETTMSGCSGESDELIIQIGNNSKPFITVIGSLELCQGEFVVLDAGANYTDYLWSDGKTSRYDTIYSSGKYWFAVNDNFGFAGFSDTVIVVVYPIPNKPTINAIHNIIYCLESANSYQWYLNKLPIIGANSKTYSPVEQGFYCVEISNTKNCKAKSDEVYVYYNSIRDNKDENDCIVSINNNTLILEFSINNISPKDLWKNASCELYNLYGQKICSYIINELYNQFDISNLVNGVYFLKLQINNNIYFKKIAVF